MRCYTEEVDYDIEALGNGAWATGCALCGDSCWEKDEAAIKRIDKELDAQQEQEEAT